MMTRMWKCLPIGFLLLLVQNYRLGACDVPFRPQPEGPLPPAVPEYLNSVLQALKGGNKLNITGIALTREASTGSESESLWKGLPETWQRFPSKLSSAIIQSVQTGLEIGGDERDFAEFISMRLRQPDATRSFWTTSKQNLSADSSPNQAVPGITAAVYQDFLTKASAVAVKLLEENFKKVKLKSVEAIAQVPVVGPFAMKLENVKLEGLKLDKTSTGVSLGDDGTFDLVISGLDAVVDGHFQWRRTRFPFISGGCQAQVTAVNGNVRVKATVVRDRSGRPKIADLSAAQLAFDSLSIVTSGAKLSWLYNAVAAFAHTEIQEAITKAVSKQISTTVPGQVNHVLDGVPIIVHVKDLDLNTSLAKDPEVTPERLIVWDWGRFQNPAHVLQECPFVRRVSLGAKAKPVMPGGSPYQIIADVDESIVNCLTWDMYKKGKLQALVQGDNLPEKALYTDSWRLIIPAVYNKCPGCPMAVKATVTSAPSTLIHESQGIVTKGTAELSFFLAEQAGGGTPWTPIGSTRRLKNSEESAQNHSETSSNLSDPRSVDCPRKFSGEEVESQKDGEVGHFQDEKLLARQKGFELGEHLFTLSLAGELLVHDLSLDQDSSDSWRLDLSMKINQKALAVQVLESDVGKINEAALHFGLTVAAFLVEDKVNHGILADGFPLPDIPHVKVERANVTVAEHALAIGADFSYLEH